MYKFLPICLAAAVGVSAYPSPMAPGGGPPHGGPHHGGPHHSMPMMPPATPMDKRVATQYLSTFEDIDENGNGVGGTIGPYNGLNWVNFDAEFVSPAPSVIGGLLGDQPIVPISPDTLARTVDGDFSNDASLTTQYPGSVVDTFDLHSLYLACGDETGLIGTIIGGANPSICYVTIAGYHASLLVARTTVAYVPTAGAQNILNGGSGSNMRLVNLTDSFTNLDEVRIFAANNQETLVYLDNVRYTTYNILEDGESA